MEEAAELARRAIYHATFRDGASGGVASGMFHESHPQKKRKCNISWLSPVFLLYIRSMVSVFVINSWIVSVYHVGPNGWKKLSGDDVGELHYHYYPVEVAAVEQEMAEVPVA